MILLHDREHSALTFSIRLKQWSTDAFLNASYNYRISSKSWFMPLTCNAWRNILMIFSSYIFSLGISKLFYYLFLKKQTEWIQSHIFWPDGPIITLYSSHIFTQRMWNPKTRIVRYKAAASNSTITPKIVLKFLSLKNLCFHGIFKYSNSPVYATPHINKACFPTIPVPCFTQILPVYTQCPIKKRSSENIEVSRSYYAFFYNSEIYYNANRHLNTIW